MTNLVKLDSERLDLMDKVMEMKLEEKSNREISKTLGITNAVVVQLQDEYRFALANDIEVRERARDSIRLMDKRFDMVIAKYWEIFREVEDHLDQNSFTAPMVAQKQAALKGVLDADSRRLDAWQKAGVLEGEDLAEEMADLEEKQQILVGILQNDLCPECRFKIKDKLQRVTQQPEVIRVVTQE